MGAIVSCFSSLLVTAEKLSLWVTCTVLICCLVTTIAIILGLGVGLGYNYCFVDMLTRYRYVPAHYIYSDSPRWPYPVDKDHLMGPQPAKVTMKPKVPNDSLENAGASTPASETTINTTTTTTTTTASPQPTITSILTTTVTPTNPYTSPIHPAPRKMNLVSANTDIYPLSNKKLATDNVAEKNWNDDKTRDDLEKVNSINSMPAASVGFVPVFDDAKKTVVPVSDLDLIRLLSKMRADGKNYKVQIVTSQ